MLNNDNKYLIIKNINKTLSLSFDFYNYETIYNNILEKGLKLVFYNQLNKGQLIKIHIILKEHLKNYECFFINSEKYWGCIKGILFNNACNVGFKIIEPKEQILTISN